jgi:glycerol-3-phosphate dehydrogenase
MSITYKTDIVVLGGGISGLWMLNAFQQLGYNSLLIEKNVLGGAQTLASQGMIHGGIKYALGGFTTPASESIADMPETWEKCLSGNGTGEAAIDLTSVEQLSNAYHLFSDGSLSSKVTSFFGSRSIRSRVSSVPRDQYPEPFSNPGFSGWLYKLQDIVLNTRSLIETLSYRAGDTVFRADAHLVRNDLNQVTHVDLGNNERLEAKLYILAAGSGNAELLSDAGIESTRMQERPLHQVMVCSEKLPHIFAHAVNLRSANKPRITFTTHSNKMGTPVWYLGGNLAETGVERSEGAQIDVARKELEALFPWLEMKDTQWATLLINRAEPAQAEQTRPDHPFFKRNNNVLVCWPTKLTLVPMMVEEILSTLPSLLEPPTQAKTTALPKLPQAPVGDAPWEISF